MKISMDVSHAEVAVLLERERQRQAPPYGYGFDADHDDRENKGQLLRGAICYGTATRADGVDDLRTPDWPWPNWPAPSIHSSHRRNLVKMAALAIAEIERIDRMGIKANLETPE